MCMRCVFVYIGKCECVFCVYWKSIHYVCLCIREGSRVVALSKSLDFRYCAGQRLISDFFQIFGQAEPPHPTPPMGREAACPCGCCSSAIVWVLVDGAKLWPRFVGRSKRQVGDPVPIHIRTFVERRHFPGKFGLHQSLSMLLFLF